MPAMLEDAQAPHIPSPQSLPLFYTSNADISGNASPSGSISGSLSPSPPPAALPGSLPASIAPRLVTLRDRITSATLIPFLSSSELPPGLLAHLCAQLNLEIEKGDTYPLLEPLSVSAFGSYWFQNFGAVMFLGDRVDGKDQLQTLEEAGEDWHRICLGTFYIKPNYPGRSSHVCNGGFIVTDAARNKGVGRLMGEAYLAWAPKLNYVYSVFNLVYETNVASIRIWEALGFKRIGRVKGAGNLRSSPHELVDAIIYGRDLGPESADFVSDERFEKIRFYLKHGKYPNGADRAEKSRLRSAATHYKLLPAEDDDERASGRGMERLMLKDKEVVADAQRQYEIARRVHAYQHAGINKSTAIITEKYHWVRIKETVSLVIKNCLWCKDPSKPQITRPPGESDSFDSPGPFLAPGPERGSESLGGRGRRTVGAATTGPIDPNSMIERMVHFENPQIVGGTERKNRGGGGRAVPRLNHRPGRATEAAAEEQMQDAVDHTFDYDGLPGPTTIASIHESGGGGFHSYEEIPVDPRIMHPHLYPQSPLQDIHIGELGTDHELMGPRTMLSPTSASATPTMSPSAPNSYTPNFPAIESTTATPSPPMILYDSLQDPPQHQVLMDSNQDEEEDDDGNGNGNGGNRDNLHADAEIDFEHRIHRELLLSHHHHRHQELEQRQVPSRGQVHNDLILHHSASNAIDDENEDEAMDFDPVVTDDVDDVGNEDRDVEAFDPLRLHVEMNANGGEGKGR